ncbi:unnamed protein product [Urochloa humidicola]
MADAIPGSPEPNELSDWVLMDRFGRTHCYTDTDAAAAAVANDATAVAIDTSNNQSGYLSFTLRPPVTTSFLDLHWPYGIPESLHDLPAFPAVLSSDGNSPKLHYVPVPGNQKYDVKTLVERYCPESFRNVSVSQGIMHFVHIDNCLRCETGAPAITIWNLMMTDDSWNWEIHCLIKLDDLWMQPVGTHPSTQPEYPVMTKDAHVLCVVMRHGIFGKARVVRVDTIQGLVLSCADYVNEQIFCHGAVVDSVEYKNYYPEVPLLPTDFPRNLKQITRM